MSKVFSRLKKKKKNVKPNSLAIKFPRFFSTPSPLSWLLVFDILSTPHAIPHTPSIWDLRVDYLSDNNYLLFVWLTPVTILSQKPLHNKCTVSKPYISDCLHCLLLINRVSVNPAKPWKRAIKNHFFFFSLTNFFSSFLFSKQNHLNYEILYTGRSGTTENLMEIFWDTDLRHRFD